MPLLVDPSVVLPSFQKAMDAGVIEVHPCTLDKTLFHHLDIADGEPRMTYARLDKAKQVTVLVQFFNAEPYEGERCFDVGWAVPLKFRGKGRAGEAFLAAVRELRHIFLSKQQGKKFYLEGIIGVDNLASRKTAEKVFASAGISGTDTNSGAPILQFVRCIENTTNLRLP
ncbi:GNAT family protein [Polaromonas glacialis]|uniref:GNAT family protein n=1 Tax=Polaromonas glacialis TaxID=866564 RepID=UPI0012EBD21D|nr:GNAT family protein [Polaromonas glacialis]